MAKHTQLIAALLLAAPLFGQAPASGASIAQVSVRLIKASDALRNAGYDPSSEVRIQGQVMGAEGKFLLMKMAFGVVRVDLGCAGRDLASIQGQMVEMVVSKVMQAGAQRLLARTIQVAGMLIQLRNQAGVVL